MPETLPITPYVPQYITVHLGAPSANAENVTVSFPDYVKNVASSEIYPTWEPAALRANILAIISFALNRVYTEFYPSRGYPFNITASTAYDQKFIKGRNIFENISRLVDELFTTYIRRIGFVEPLAAKFCNGTTVTCDGLSQWGSQALAEEGRDSMAILRYYYGDNIELVTNAPVRGIRYSYPGSPLRRGSRGEAVQRVQVMLNRTTQEQYDAAYAQAEELLEQWKSGPATEASVKTFQQVFDLTDDGIVGSGTWYKLVFLYVGVLDLAELISQGQTYYPSGGGSQPFPSVLREGSRGEPVKVIQYLLSVVGEFYSAIPEVAIDGIFGPATKNAVTALQRLTGLPQDGINAARYVNVSDKPVTVTLRQFKVDVPKDAAANVAAAMTDGSLENGYTLAAGQSVRVPLAAPITEKNVKVLATGPVSVKIEAEAVVLTAGDKPATIHEIVH